MYRSVLFLLIFAFCQADAQSVLYLKNPSFEDVPNDSRPPKFWKDEGFEEYTPTDIHPSGSYGVTAKAADGKTYVGMVVRDDESWECIGQPLSKPLQADSCYFMAVKLMRSPEYQSMSPLKRAPANFNKPCVLRVWGGKKKGKGMKLLHETSPVDHTHWKTYGKHAVNPMFSRLWPSLNLRTQPNQERWPRPTSLSDRCAAPKKCSPLSRNGSAAA